MKTSTQKLKPGNRSLKPKICIKVLGFAQLEFFRPREVAKKKTSVMSQNVAAFPCKHKAKPQDCTGCVCVQHRPRCTSALCPAVRQCAAAALSDCSSSGTSSWTVSSASGPRVPVLCNLLHVTLLCSAANACSSPAFLRLWTSDDCRFNGPEMHCAHTVGWKHKH